MVCAKRRTTKMMPSSLTNVQRSVCCSVLYGALLAAEVLVFNMPEALFSSTNTSVMKLLMMEGLTGAHFRDHTTTPDVVTISKVSSMVAIMVGLLSRERVERTGRELGRKREREKRSGG